MQSSYRNCSKRKNVNAKTASQPCNKLCKFILTELSAWCMSWMRHCQSLQWDFLPGPCNNILSNEHRQMHQNCSQKTDRSTTWHLYVRRTLDFFWHSTYNQFSLGISRQMSSSFVKELFNKTLSARRNETRWKAFLLKFKERTLIYS